MHLSLSKDTVALLMKGMREVVKRAGPHGDIPVVLISSKNGTGPITVTGANQRERLIFHVVDDEVPDDSGEDFVLPFRKLRSAAVSLRKHDILHITNYDGYTGMTFERSGTSVPLLVNYVHENMFPDEFEMCLDAPRHSLGLVDALRTVSPFAAKVDSCMPVLVGALYDDDDACVIGTDGKILAKWDLPGCPLSRAVRIPLTRLINKNGVLDGADGDVALGQFDYGELGAASTRHSLLVVRSGPWVYQVRCYDADRFPPYTHLLPRQHHGNPEVDLLKSNLPMLNAKLKYATMDRDSETHVVLCVRNGVVLLVVPRQGSGCGHTVFRIPNVYVDPESECRAVRFPIDQLLKIFGTGCYIMEFVDDDLPVRFYDQSRSSVAVCPLQPFDAHDITRTELFDLVDEYLMDCRMSNRDEELCYVRHSEISS